MAAHCSIAFGMFKFNGTVATKFRELFRSVSKSGAKMYGAFWCPHCQQQKAMFGASASRLPYIECSPNGQGAPQADVCKAENIASYPTWVINGKHIAEVLSLKDLAADTGFQLGTSQPNQTP